MLLGEKAYRTGDVLFHFRVAFEREFRIYAVERRGNIVDGRFFRGAARMGGGHFALFVLLDGSIRFANDLGTLAGPAAFVVDLAEDIGLERSSGEPYRAIELVLFDAPPAWRGPPRAVALAPELLDAAKCFFDRFGSEPGASARDFVRAASRHVPGMPELDASIVAEEDEVLLRVWAAFVELDLVKSPFPSYQEIADKSGASASHFARLLKDVLQTFHLDWGGWRDLTNVARLRWAVMMISNPDLPIAEVARGAGYGSTDALDATFRRAGLPPPRDVRRMILEG